MAVTVSGRKIRSCFKNSSNELHMTRCGGRLHSSARLAPLNSLSICETDRFDDAQMNRAKKSSKIDFKA